MEKNIENTSFHVSFRKEDLWLNGSKQKKV